MLCKLEKERGTAPPHCLFRTEYAHLTQSGEWFKYIKPTIHQSPSFLSTALHLCKANNRGNSCYDPTIILKSRGAIAWWKHKNAFSFRNPSTKIIFVFPFSYFACTRTSDSKRSLIKITFACFLSPVPPLLFIIAVRPPMEYRTGVEKPFQTAADIPSFNNHQSEQREKGSGKKGQLQRGIGRRLGATLCA